MEKGRIIFLNGVTSAGKTSIVEALHTAKGKPALLLSQAISSAQKG